MEQTPMEQTADDMVDKHEDAMGIMDTCQGGTFQ
jgi:hypothetical protein